MKRIIIILSILFFEISFTYSQNVYISVPINYENSKTFAVINNNDTIISFSRNGKDKLITTGSYNRILKKRKVLVSNQGDTIAVYKKKNIIFPQQNIVVNEKKIKNGWNYYLSENKILAINYDYIRSEKRYKINVAANNLDDLTLSIIQVSLGKFDKRVVMDYDSVDDYFIPIIVALTISII